MGAKQSKRSVDISGKEAEGGGEVAAAGAGGEGRVEQIADVDALKPQINGDAHIQHEQTDKEKELDSGTPENEKDATTEKEGKDNNEKENEVAPVTNGEAEEKIENGESTPIAEDGKKPKKEKVKKKWSLRSISFSRKDKPKQEKKQKDEEPKTNGEPEKVPEEAAETTPEIAVSEIAEEVKVVSEIKEETTPETPVTEPLTNGSSTPESAKAETPAVEEAAPAPTPEADKVELKPEPEPEQLPVNGLSLEDNKPEPVEVEKPEDTKLEPPVAETVETAPAPEIPVKEVCVEQMPLLEPTPPPLPANPPPSSVVSFAATTMAPELTDASLSNTAESANTPTSALPDTKDVVDEIINEPQTSVTDNDVIENIPSPKLNNSIEVPETKIEQEELQQPPIDVDMSVAELANENTEINGEKSEEVSEVEIPCLNEPIIDNVVESKLQDIDVEPVDIPQPESESPPANDSPLPPPPPAADDDDLPAPIENIEQLTNEIQSLPEEIKEVKEIVSNHVSDVVNGVSELALDEIDTEGENLKNKTKSVANSVVEKIECNGDREEIIADVTPKENGTSAETVAESAEQSEGAAARHTPQEVVTVADKLADMIPEVPDVPELKTETLQETVSDVAVAN